MQIGRLRKRLRGYPRVEPEYYDDYASFKAFGEYLSAKICPYDGKAFLHWHWRWQHKSVWHGHSVNGLIPAASIDYDLRWRKGTKANEKYSYSLTRFSELYYDIYDDIIVSCTYSLKGAWIGWGGESPHITVLETTRLKVKFKAERREVLLPPGATIFLSPLTLIQKLGENISVKKRRRRIPTQVMEVFASAKTPQELAARLELEPIRLREKLEDRDEVMRR